MKSWKRIFVLGALLVAPVALESCASPTPYGLIYTEAMAPTANFAITNYQVDRGDYQVLGPAEGMGEFINVLGLIAIGDAGYQTAFARACQAKGADNLIDAKADIKIFSILGIFCKVNYKVSGIAVKRK